MLNVTEELKNILKNDYFPRADELAPKDLIISFPTLGLTIETDQIVDDSFALDEKLCSEEDLVFGSCEASQIKFTVADVDQDLKGLWFTISQVVNGATTPLGTYKVYSCKKQGNLRFKDIIAYDALKDTDVDVSDWYRGLTFPLTLKQFRASLLAYLGIEESTSDFRLTNDDMIVERTIDPGQLSGRAVLQACEEINGVFGHIGRDGKFKHIVLEPGYGLYPSDDLYPADDLYPVGEDDTSFTMGEIIDETVDDYMINEIRFEEYTVKEIDKLIIRSEEDDIGAIVGDGTNAYIIQGNFLVFGKSASELESIAQNAFGNMAKRPYRPYEAENIGLPYIEVGDTLEFATDDTVTGYVLQRTLKGMQALTDNYTATGNEERELNFGVNRELIQLQGKYTLIKKDVEGVRIEVGDLAKNTASQFELTDEQIALKVGKDGVIAAINLTSEEAKISADKINLEGLVTVTSLTTPGSVVIDGGNLKAGTVIADEVRADWVYAGNINASQINAGSISGDRISGGTIDGVIFKSTGPSYGTTIIESGYIRSYSGSNEASFSMNGIHINHPDGDISLQAGNIVISNGLYANSVTCSSINANSHTHYTNTIYPSLTYPAENIGFNGKNAASVTWCNANFQPISSSDLRLKKDISNIDDRIDEFYYNLKPKQYKFKPINDGTSESPLNDNKVHFGLIAQQVKSNLESAGLIEDFALVKSRPVKKYSNEGLYVNDEVMRIEYEELITLTIYQVQKLYKEIYEIKNKLF